MYKIKYKQLHVLINELLQKQYIFSSKQNLLYRPNLDIFYIFLLNRI